ncbi:molybdenum ABC transporter ATP-binding protein [Limibaculum sp. FT325]|uniref:molybdenum ABC transporter ATP-binding protein n=1 Tax=Thermohalobaculum sediminis TaxID=2939436 RepID=UPI0020BDD735|nr:molybdenum ABC transporter ATP-binding protein [Limibaculum sediminis]MCL5777457.1 molybdenum ABC transporter ATP-binding protein [Limibaculum sediminis]
MAAGLRIDVRARLGGFGLDVAHAFALSGVTALFGASGSGKTTLLRIIAGLEDAADGEVSFADEIWLATARGIRVPAHRRGVGVVFQDARLFAHLDVAGNLRYALRRARRNGPAPGLEAVAAALDLGPLLARRTGALSGGERQRVAMGRALLSSPRLMLLDEPLAALDNRRKAAILPYIERVVHEFGVPAIYVTHAIDEVAHLADRIVVLAEGRVAATGDLPEALERLDLQPLTGHFEAGVVLEVRVTAQDLAHRLTHVDFGGQPLVMPMLDLPLGAEIRLRARARDVSVATERPRGLSIRNVIEGRVAAIALEPDTAFAEVVLETPGGPLRARLTRLSVEELGLGVGQPAFALIKSVAFDRRVLPRGPGQAG